MWTSYRKIYVITWENGETQSIVGYSLQNALRSHGHSMNSVINIKNMIIKEENK